ncbi:hypothetical protein MMC29_003052 [Sticta canariensis]|nr:hypothetical protein [Sticta canariensis]
MSSPDHNVPNPKGQSLTGEPVVFQLRAGTRQILLSLFVRGCTILLLVRAPVFGSKLQIFPLKETSLWGILIEPDLQLVLIGVVNKILDYLTQNGLEHLALMILILWMAHEPVSSHLAGVHVSDYEIMEELMKPWVAAANFYSALFHILATLLISVSFLLLGARMNTVGIPNGRWYANLWLKTKASDALMALRTPQMKLLNIDWTIDWDLGRGIVGDGSQSWNVAIALASASTFSALVLWNIVINKSRLAGWDKKMGPVLEPSSILGSTD